jgi:hypothetical protein
MERQQQLQTAERSLQVPNLHPYTTVSTHYVLHRIRTHYTLHKQYNPGAPEHCVRPFCTERTAANNYACPTNSARMHITRTSDAKHVTPSLDRISVSQHTQTGDNSPERPLRI